MARGNIAKEKVEKKIIEAFGSDFVGVDDKKLYVWADDGGEMVQIALSMTCPKVFIEGSAAPAPAKEKVEDWDWTNTTSEKPKPKKKTEVTQEELDNIETLMKKFNLI